MPEGISEMGPSSEAAVRYNNKHASLASSSGNKVMTPSVLEWQKTAIALLAGSEFMPCSAFGKAWHFENEAYRAFGKTKGATPPR